MYGEIFYKDIIDIAKKYTNEICVAFSCGKDSLVLLDIISKHFCKFSVVFQYLVRDLSFQTSIISYVEKKYNTKIIQIPHWDLMNLYTDGYYRPSTKITEGIDKVYSVRDGITNMKKVSGMQWIAYGTKKSDSITMRRFLTHLGACLKKLQRVYPLSNFSDKAIYSYLKYYRIPLPSDYRFFGRSMIFEPYNYIALKENLPEDFEKIKEIFPYVEAATKQTECYGIKRNKFAKR